MKRSNWFCLILLVSGLLACGNKTDNKKHDSQIEEVDFLQAKDIQLASPKVSIDSVFFKNTAEVTLSFTEENSQILYQIDDKKFQVYQVPFNVVESSLVRAKVKKERFQESEVVTNYLVKVSGKTDSAIVEMSPNPSENYPGEGVASLIDNKKGGLDFKNDNAWLGMQTRSLTISLILKKTTRVESVFLSFLSDQKSWIFLPEIIKISANGNEIGVQQLATPEAIEKPNSKIIKIPIKSGDYKKLNIHLSTKDGIPEWHPGKGGNPWYFIDEILIE